MKTHIMISLLALIITACASKQDVAKTPYDYDRSQHAQMIDGSASRIR